MKCNGCGVEYELVHVSENEMVFKCPMCGKKTTVSQSQNNIDDYYVSEINKIENKINNLFLNNDKKNFQKIKDELENELISLKDKFPSYCNKDLFYNLLYLKLVSNNFKEKNKKVNYLKKELSSYSVLFKSTKDRCDTLYYKLNELYAKKKKKHFVIAFFSILVCGALIAFVSIYLLNPNLICGGSYIMLNIDGIEKQVNVNHSKSFEVDVPDKKGYKFTGFYDENNNLIIDSKGKSVSNCDWFKGLKVSAKWETQQVTLHYITGTSDVIEDKVVDYDSSLNSLAVLSKTGYEFNGWTISNGTESVNLINKNNSYINGKTLNLDNYKMNFSNSLTIKCEWKPIKISFIIDGKVKNVTYDTSFDNYLNSTRVGYDFVGFIVTINNKTKEFSPDDLNTIINYDKLGFTSNDKITVNSIWVAKTINVYIVDINGKITKNFKMQYDDEITKYIDLNTPNKIDMMKFTGWQIISNNKTVYLTDENGNFMHEAMLNLEKYGLEESTNVTIKPEYIKNNDIDYAGGGGTSDNPYLISSLSHLINISKNMDSHYLLTNDISLKSIENWNAIGGHYENGKIFNGHLDGNGKTIKNFTRKVGISESGDRTYYGLFARIGVNGYIENLNFANVNVSLSGPAVDNSNNKIFGGVLAGKIYGKVDNVNVLSGSFAYNCNTNGASYIGGIGGYLKDGTILNCSNNAIITSGRYAGVGGGIFGYASGGLIQKCKNKGLVQVLCTGWGGGAQCGGIIGEVYDKKIPDIFECENSGELRTQAYEWSIIGHTENKNNMIGNKYNEEF